MVSSILIIAFSAVLLCYWFRYTCLIILRTKPSFDYTADVVHANGLKFAEVRGQLNRRTEFEHLRPLHKALVEDYRLLTYLLRHTGGLHVGGITIEQRMLMIDFKVMQICYALASLLGMAQARRALQEMSNVLSHLANVMGERAAASVQG